MQIEYMQLCRAPSVDPPQFHLFLSSKPQCCLPASVQVVDFNNPFVNLSLSKRSLLPSRLITMIGNCSTRSYVVNLFTHLLHSRRLLTVIPSSAVLVSTTSVFSFLQNIQCICGVYNDLTTLPAVCQAHYTIS
jgi:hypothetical protein